MHTREEKMASQRKP